MKIFEFQFNPKARKDRFFRVFSFGGGEGEAPELGGLYIVGELANALPSNAQFLERLAAAIRKEYYGSGQELEDPRSGLRKDKGASPPAKLKLALRKANEFLAEETKKGNVDWLGNLHFAVLAFIPGEAASSFYFTKVGAIKMWMARNGALVDVGKNLEDVGAGEQPSKVFGNVVAGRVAAEDRVMVCTKDVFDLFAKENMLRDFAFLQEEKQFSRVFRDKKGELGLLSGIFFFALVEAAEQAPLAGQAPRKPQERGKGKTGTGRQNLLPFRLPERRLLWPPTLPFKSLPRPFLPHISAPRISLPSLAIPKVSIPHPLLFPRPAAKGKTSAGAASESPFLRKSALLVVIFGVLLIAGFVIFQSEGVQVSKEAQAAFEKAAALQAQAESALAANDEKQANKLFQEAWGIARSYLGEGANVKEKKQATALLAALEERLAVLNNVEEIEAPIEILDVPEDAIGAPPARLLLAGDNLYLFHPFSSEILAFDTRTGAQNVLQAGRNVTYGSAFGNSAAFFAEPDTLLFFDQQSNLARVSLSMPGRDFSFNGMKSFGQNIYFFDSGTGDMVKYANPVVSGALAVSWIDALSAKRPLGAVSMAIDGNIWILREGREIQRYFMGRYEETLELGVFPFLEQGSRVATSAQAPYLYILDPSEHRLLALTKFGDVIAQYRSEAFDNLLDLAVSPDGTTAYLLNGSRVYQISDIPVEL